MNKAWDRDSQTNRLLSLVFYHIPVTLPKEAIAI